jgi:hypothetical protein
LFDAQAQYYVVKDNRFQAYTDKADSVMDIEDFWRANRDRVQAQKEEITCDVPTGWTEGLVDNPKIIDPDKDYNSYAGGGVYETVMRMLRDSGMASRGKGRTLVTDNWYSSGFLMAGIWKEFGMTFMGTIYLASKKSRTAEDFPFHKLSPVALRRVKRGWCRTATQNVKIGRQTAFTMQAREKKQVAMLHNVDVIQPDQDTHKVLRMSPKSKKKKEVNSPGVIFSYASTYNGVDRKDKDTSDWIISVKSHRWYLRLY